jgi:predicted aspartyl protease
VFCNKKRFTGKQINLEKKKAEGQKIQNTVLLLENHELNITGVGTYKTCPYVGHRTKLCEIFRNIGSF